MSPQPVTVASVRATYNDEKRRSDRKHLWGYALRKLSWHPSWLFIRLGISPNKITALSLASGALGALSLAYGSYVSIIVGALLVNLYNLLDYVDGNVARYNNATSSFGQLFDDIVGFTVYILSFLGAGIGIFHNPQVALGGQSLPFLGGQPTGYLFLLVGVITGWAFSLRFFSRFVLIHVYQVTDHEREHTTSKGGGAITVARRSLHGVEQVNEHVISLQMPLLMVSALFQFLGPLLILYALAYSLATALFITQMLTAMAGARRSA